MYKSKFLTSFRERERETERECFYLQCFIWYINDLLVGVSRASRCLLSTSLTVDRLTVTCRHEWAERDLTATIAVALRLLGPTEEVRIEASREGHPGSFGSLRGEREREREREIVS